MEEPDSSSDLVSFMILIWDSKLRDWSIKRVMAAMALTLLLSRAWGITLSSRPLTSMSVPSGLSATLNKPS